MTATAVAIVSTQSQRLVTIPSPSLLSATNTGLGECEARNKKYNKFEMYCEAKLYIDNNRNQTFHFCVFVKNIHASEKIMC